MPARLESEATRLTLLQLPVIFQRQGGDPPEFLPKLGTKLDRQAATSVPRLLEWWVPPVTAAFMRIGRPPADSSRWEATPVERHDARSDCRRADHDVGSIRSSAPSSSSVSR